MGGPDREFPTTSWSAILSARDPASPSFRQQWDRLVSAYWKPVYFYVRACGKLNVEDAKDLTQAFFSRFLEKEHWARLDPERGSFRGFLKTSIRRFLIDSVRHEASQRPPSGVREFNVADLESGVADPGPDADPETRFDREWIRTVVTSAVELLKTRLIESGAERDYEAFAAYCLPEAAGAAAPAATGGLTYREVAERLDMTESEVRKRLHRARGGLREIVRDVVSEYIGDPDEIEAELKFILDE